MQVLISYPDYPHTTAERRPETGHPQVIAWESLLPVERQRHFNEATKAGTGAVTHLIFNTYDEISFLYLHGCFNAHPEITLQEILESRITISTVTFQINLNQPEAPVDVVRLHGLPPDNAANGRFAFLGTIPAQQFQNLFANQWLQ